MRKTLRKIYQELVAIREEIQVINKSLEPKDYSFTTTSRDNANNLVPKENKDVQNGEEMRDVRKRDKVDGKLLETYYKEGDNGEIIQCYRFRGEELAKMSDVYAWHKIGNLYTDECYIRSKVAIGIAIASIAISAVSCFICMCG